MPRAKKPGPHEIKRTKQDVAHEETFQGMIFNSARAEQIYKKENAAGAELALNQLFEKGERWTAGDNVFIRLTFNGPRELSQLQKLKTICEKASPFAKGTSANIITAHSRFTMEIGEFDKICRTEFNMVPPDWVVQAAQEKADKAKHQGKH